MKAIRANAKKIGVMVSVFLVGVGFVPTVPVMARTLDEIQADINEQSSALNGVQNQLKEAEKNLQNQQSALNNAQGQIPRLEAEIAQIEAQLAFNKLQMQLLAESQKLKQFEQEQREQQQVSAMKNAYVDWRSRSQFAGYLTNSGEKINPIKSDKYQLEVIAKESKGIDQLIVELEEIAMQLGGFEEASSELELQNAELAKRKAELQTQVMALQSSVTTANGAVAGLRGQVNALSAAISQLSEEQKALENYEAYILGQSGNGGTQEVQTGEFYFTGKGRELYQGHGVGMSQFGAYGAAAQGWTAQQILSLYYANTHIETRPGTINVQGYGTMDINTYAAGQAEVPGRACGNAEQVASNPSKYVIDNPNTIWDCWPEEAIKAQIIAFRSYGLNYQSNYGSICTTTSCQVYNGGTYSSWAAEETRDMVIVSHGYSDNGQVIQALYSSDNHNGWGTADNDTRFSTIQGNGTPVSYLRAVDDRSITYKTNWTEWAWRTNGYTNADLDNMITFATSDPYLYQSSRDYMWQIKSSIGNVGSFTFERDPSGRVRKVLLTGTNGVTMPMAGWFFKVVWNSWIDTVQPSGQKDFIYSQTFYYLTK